MTKLPAFAAQCSASKWFALWAATIIAIFVARDWNDLSSSWMDLRAIGVEPWFIVTSLMLSWSLQIKFWVALIAACLTAWLVRLSCQSLPQLRELPEQQSADASMPRELAHAIARRAHQAETA